MLIIFIVLCLFLVAIIKNIHHTFSFDYWQITKFYTPGALATHRLENAIAIYSLIAYRILWITYQSRITPEINCEIFLKKHEWQSLYCMVNKTNILPLNPPTIKEAILMIAKLGGFLEKKSDGYPGVKVIWRGMKRLEDISYM